MQQYGSKRNLLIEEYTFGKVKKTFCITLRYLDGDVFARNYMERKERSACLDYTTRRVSMRLAYGSTALKEKEKNAVWCS